MSDNWRPQRLDQYIGQRHIIHEIRDEIIATKADCKPMFHRILYGESGLGKTTLAKVIAEERGVPLVYLVGRELTHQALSNILARLPRDGYATGRNLPAEQRGRVIDRRQVQSPLIFVDEADGVPRHLLQLLHEPMEGEHPDGRPHVFHGLDAYGDPVTFWIPAVTFYFATNFLADLRKADPAIESRCSHPLEFEPYSIDELTGIILQLAGKTGQQIDDTAARAIAGRSRDVPRNAIQLFREAAITLRAAQVTGRTEAEVITDEVVEQTFTKKGIDEHGLDRPSRRYLETIGHTSERRKMGIETIAGNMGLERRTAEAVIEPFLFRSGLAEKGSGGRWITDKGRRAIGMRMINPALSHAI
jgi:holliday junction DNA helicase RuvB